MNSGETEEKNDLFPLLEFTLQGVDLGCFFFLHLNYKNDHCTHQTLDST